MKTQFILIMFIISVAAFMIFLLAGCSAAVSDQKSAIRNQRSEIGIPEPPGGMVLPPFQYWPGIETNYSRLQSSADLITWSNWPQLYYGAPIAGADPMLITNAAPQQFYRMVKVP